MYNFTVKLPSDVKLPMIATEEDTGPFVKALVTSPRTNLNLVAYREWMSLEELAQTWSRTLGVPARNVTIPFDKDWEIVEDELKEELDETMRYMTEFGYEGRDDPSVVHPRDVSTYPTTPMETICESACADSLLSFLPLLVGCRRPASRYRRGVDQETRLEFRLVEPCLIRYS